MSQPNDQLENYAKALESSGDFKVLRRLPDLVTTNRPLVQGERVAVVVDTETTGLNLRHDEVTELAMVAFAYDEQGTVTDVLDTYSQLREPSIPITSESEALTGITTEMVQGKRINLEVVERILERAAVVIAHNAAFDRPMCERLSPAFAEVSWACTATQVDWRKLGFEGTKLIYLLYQFGAFHDGHRALDDASATLEILRRPVPLNGITVMPVLLENARASTTRIWVESASQLAPTLRARGYRWQNGSAVRKQSWWKEVNDAQAPRELKFLEEQSMLVRSIERKRITAFERFKLDL